MTANFLVVNNSKLSDSSPDGPSLPPLSIHIPIFFRLRRASPALLTFPMILSFCHISRILKNNCSSLAGRLVWQLIVPNSVEPVERVEPLKNQHCVQETEMIR